MPGKFKDEQYVADIAMHIAGAVDDYRNDLPEILWTSSLVMMENAIGRTRNWHWWRSYPTGELRRLRERMAHALMLARFAADLQEAENAHERELDRELREAAADAGRKRRRAQTLPAERARLEKHRQRREEAARRALEALDGRPDL